MFKLCTASHNCTAANDEIHGYGCKLKNMTPENEIVEINLLTGKEEHNTNDEITWIHITTSHLDEFPNVIFENFMNMKTIFVTETTGFTNLDRVNFDKKISMIYFKGTELEVISEKAFTGLTHLESICLDANKITKVHKNAFGDLENLEQIEIEYNQIETLDDEIFAKNLKLNAVFLAGNRLTFINAKFFANNLELKSIDFRENMITQVEKNFLTSSSALMSADFTLNICIDEKFTLNTTWTLFQTKFNQCNINFATMKQTNDKLNQLFLKIDGLENGISDIKTQLKDETRKQEKLLKDFITNGKTQNDLTGKFVFIYFALFAISSFAIVAVFYFIWKFKLFSKKNQCQERAELLEL